MKTSCFYWWKWEFSALLNNKCWHFQHKGRFLIHSNNFQETWKYILTLLLCSHYNIFITVEVFFFFFSLCIYSDSTMPTCSWDFTLVIDLMHQEATSFSSNVLSTKCLVLYLVIDQAVLFEISVYCFQMFKSLLYNFSYVFPLQLHCKLLNNRINVNISPHKHLNWIINCHLLNYQVNK